MNKPFCYAASALLIVAGSPLWASAQEHYRLLTYRAVSVVSLEGPSASSGGGPGSDGIVVGYSSRDAVVLTVDGHLVVNGDYHGQVSTEAKTKVVVAAGRVFVDGIRRSPQDFPDDVEQQFFGKPDQAIAEYDYSDRLRFPRGSKVFVRDTSLRNFQSFGNKGGRRTAGIGPYVLGMTENQVFSVWGVPYGQVQEGDTIEVYRGHLLINGTVQPPTQAPLQRR